MKDKDWDKLLKIKTTGRDDSHADSYWYPYEPTPYNVLERLASTGYIRKGNTVLDYGCGKGRVDFFLSWQTRCRSIGIENNKRIYEKALENSLTGAASGRVSFKLANAEQFSVPITVDRIYFFNPFSLEILRKVMNQILISYYESPRECILFFYYPSNEYMTFLLTLDELTLIEEIDCRDLEGNNSREQIVIFTIKNN